MKKFLILTIALLQIAIYAEDSSLFKEYYPDNTIKYEGEYQNGKRHGKGTFYYEKNDILNHLKYVGDFKNNKYNGQGTLYKKNGDIINSGIWKNWRSSLCSPNALGFICITYSTLKACNKRKKDHKYE